jgi:hypothetical protein
MTLDLLNVRRRYACRTRARVPSFPAPLDLGQAGILVWPAGRKQVRRVARTARTASSIASPNPFQFLQR